MDARPHERAISFRHLFTVEIEQFLRREGLGFENADAAIGELIIALARYREEGTPLFPEVFLCDDVAAAVKWLGGIDAFMLGRSGLDADGIRRALKRAAPLSCVGWSVLLHVERSSNEIAYGLVRTDPFVLYPSAMDRLRELDASSGLRLLGIAQMEENVIELRASRGVFRHVYLSGARVDGELGPLVVERTVACLAEDVSKSLRGSVRSFWRRILGDAVRLPHGALMAIVRTEVDVRSRFADASHLAPPIDVPSHVEAYLSRHDETSRAAVQGLATLVSRMLRADGITVLRSDGSVLAYNAFVAHRPATTSMGGARRRTYETLAADVESGDLVAAFYHSQDGGALVSTGSGRSSRA